MLLPQMIEMNLHEFAHTAGYPLDDGERDHHDRRQHLYVVHDDTTCATRLPSFVLLKPSIWFEPSLQSNDS